MCLGIPDIDVRLLQYLEYSQQTEDLIDSELLFKDRNVLFVCFQWEYKYVVYKPGFDFHSQKSSGMGWLFVNDGLASVYHCHVHKCKSGSVLVLNSMPGRVTDIDR